MKATRQPTATFPNLSTHPKEPSTVGRAPIRRGSLRVSVPYRGYVQQFGKNSAPAELLGTILPSRSGNGMPIKLTGPLEARSTTYRNFDQGRRWQAGASELAPRRGSARRRARFTGARKEARQRRESAVGWLVLVGITATDGPRGSKGAVASACCAVAFAAAPASP